MPRRTKRNKYNPRAKSHVVRKIHRAKQDKLDEEAFMDSILESQEKEDYEDCNRDECN